MSNRDKNITKRKILQKILREQKIISEITAKKIEEIEADLWQIELEEVNKSGILSQLTWEYNDRVKLFGVTATGFRTKENTLGSKISKEVEEWYWKHEDGHGFVQIYKKVIGEYQIMMALDFDYEDDTEENKVVRIWALDNEETGTGVPSEKKALKTFAEKWNIDAKVDS